MISQSTRGVKTVRVEGATTAWLKGTIPNVGSTTVALMICSFETFRSSKSTRYEAFFATIGPLRLKPHSVRS